jgi:hypothetical protein
MGGGLLPNLIFDTVLRSSKLVVVDNHTVKVQQGGQAACAFLANSVDLNRVSVVELLCHGNDLAFGLCTSKHPLNTRFGRSPDSWAWDGDGLANKGEEFFPLGQEEAGAKIQKLNRPQRVTMR